MRARASRSMTCRLDRVRPGLRVEAWELTPKAIERPAGDDDDEEGKSQCIFRPVTSLAGPLIRHGGAVKRLRWMFVWKSVAE